MPSTIFWFRRDLRLHDNTGLAAALAKGEVLPIFIFDKNILDKLEDRDDPRVTFLHQELTAMKAQLEAWGTTLRVYYSTPAEVFGQIKAEFPDVERVYTNRDYEGYAKQRDADSTDRLKTHGVEFQTFKDHVIFEEREILTQSGNPFSVYSPYARTWRATFTQAMLADQPVEGRKDGFWKTSASWPMPSLQEMGFVANTTAFPSKTVAGAVLAAYAEQRDLPAVAGTSQLSLHLRFGTVSIRETFRHGMAHSDKWVAELIWREFYAQLLANNPHVEAGSFRPEYNNIPWRNNEAEFARWCEGKTGYPIVDAGMRQLNQEYWMHTRVRMIVASFLTKHLLIDWRWGGAYFARKLLDFELASNNGGWQWAAGTGADAAPYFRVFNPYLQAAKFDPAQAYIKKYVPEYNELDYLQSSIVDHTLARNRALEAYGVGLGKKQV
jgi:deoxyribodipyrimidine photo-lyase